MQEASREILWNVSHPINSVVMYALFAVSMLVFGWGLWARLRLYLVGKADNERLKNWPARFGLLWSYVARQKGVRKKREVGLFHNLIVWGFLILLFTTTMVFIDHDLNIDIYKGRFYLGVTLLSDLFGLGLLIGIALAAHQRYILKPERIHQTPADWIMLALLALLCIQGFLLEGLRIAATNDPWSLYSPVGHLVSLFFWDLTETGLRLVHFFTWWSHTITVFVFFALLPYTKFLHIFTSSANLFFKKLSPKGALRDIGDIEKIMEEALESGDENFSLGTSTLGDLSWKQKLDLDACTSCGRCQEVCPAYNSGKVLSPKWLILDTRDHMLALHAKEESGNALDQLDRKMVSDIILGLNSTSLLGSERCSNELTQNSALEIGQNADAPLAGGVMDTDVFWSCTTCRACEEVCPVGIDHVDLIVDVRRSLALMQGDIPSEAQSALRAVETRGNPYGPAEERVDWTEGLEVPILNEGDVVDILYWVGCVSAYDKRKQKIARSMVEILNRSGFSWGILGNRECCTGDPARRLGEENLYQTQAKTALSTISTVSYNTIVANCPHCFNSLKNEYPQLQSFPPPETRIVHHTQLIQELLEAGRIELVGKFEESLTFHDPCYLGRYNDTYDEPRDILVQIGAKKIHEMEQCRSQGKCCGAGGGHFWMDMKVGERVNVQRIDQAAATGASTVATGCPFCMQMLEDGVKITEREENLSVKDISELVVENLKTPN